MFQNAGKKIMHIAVALFVIETIGAVIAGFAMLFNEMELPGIITLICGPSFALLFALFVYAFGELVDDTQNIRSELNTVKKNLQILAEPTLQKAAEKARLEADEHAKRKAEMKEKLETYRQETQPSIPKTKNTTNPAAPYWCGNCGYDGPYEGNCPICNSSMKRYNV